MNKVIRDGKVAVLISPGYGAGWSSWNNSEDVFLPEIVKLVENKQQHLILDKMNQLGYTGYYGGYNDLKIEWVDVGTRFRITEYDGSEGIEYENDCVWIVA